MVCKMLLFDFREEEKSFFKTYRNDNYDIKFIKEPLNVNTIKKLTSQELEDTSIISVFITSEVSEEVILKFKNLRIISTRSARYGHIDINSCVTNNIALVNVEDCAGKSVEYVLAETFKGIMSVYCGAKNYRVV